VVRDVGTSDSSQKNCVESRELLEAVGGHHPAGVYVPVAAPVECIPIELEAKYSPSGIENPDSFSNHFFSNAISGNDRNMKGLHLLHPSRICSFLPEARNTITNSELWLPKPE
jgi:hypothetical protein